MLPTYRAVLENNQLQWLDEEPEGGHLNRPLTVLVTVVEEAREIKGPAQTERIAAILNRLAARNSLSEISDPVAWQRESREDRPLPGREL